MGNLIPRKDIDNETQIRWYEIFGYETKSFGSGHAMCKMVRVSLNIHCTDDLTIHELSWLDGRDNVL